MAKLKPFFQLHSDLPREGPGLPDDVAWAAAVLGEPQGGRVLDAACGPGADIPALLDAFAPRALVGVDRMAHFVDHAAAAFQNDARVSVTPGDMFDVAGPFDLIWCAGAIYFAGITAALTQWRPHLAAGGAIAFSTPAYFTTSPSDVAKAMWEGEGDIPNRTEIAAQIADAGYQLIATRPLEDAAWAAYYEPMRARIAMLRAQADEALMPVLDAGLEEIAAWEAAKVETGYDLCVVRPS